MNAFFKSPLLKKEVRLLLPAWGLALVLAVVPTLFFNNWPAHTEDVIGAFTPVWLGVIILCASSFGREFSLGTFSSLLAQPFPRRQYWMTKVGVLMAALVSVVAVYPLCMAQSLFAAIGWSETAWLLVLLLTAIAGGLWLALLIRQMTAVIWLVALAPAGLCLPFLLVLTHYHVADSTVSHTVYVVLLAYSIVGIIGSWRVFRQAQDVPWSGGAITLPDWVTAGILPRFSSEARLRIPWRALIRKELHFNQVLLFGMAGLFLFGLGEVGIRLLRPNAPGDFNQVLQMLGIAPWALVPLIIGCTSIAEERKLGTLEGQLCQPVSARRQFLVKLGFTLLFGGLLSSLGPVLVETIAHLIGLKADEPPAVVIAFMTLGMCGLALMAFHASSLSRNMLQALPIALGMFVGFCLVVTGLNHASGFGPVASLLGFVPWSWVLADLVLAVVLPLVLVWLAWRNFQCLPESRRIWRRNVLGLAAALVITITASVLIYHRIWDKLTPFEPAHGPARWSLSQPPVAARTDIGNGLLITLPDGRKWFGCMADHDAGPNHNELWRAWLPWQSSARMRGMFISDSNWVSLTAGFVDMWMQSGHANNSNQEGELVHIVDSRETVGIQADGTLWVSEKPTGTNWNTNALIQFGTETDWQQVLGARSFSSVVLLKKDGTLWRWGVPRPWGETNSDSAGLDSQIPRQIGTNSDWQKLVQLELPLALKRNGTLWHIDFQAKSQRDDLDQYTNVDQAGIAGAGWDAQKIATGYGGFDADIHRDGTLWIWGDNLYWQSSTRQKFTILRSSAETNWVGVEVGMNTMIALKADGTLWHWGGDREYAEEYTSPPRRLGTHDDWVALSHTWWGVTSLAADGSLWLWPDSGYAGEEPMLCKPAYKPIRLGNVFAINESH